MEIEEESSIALINEYTITNEKIKLYLLKRELIRNELIKRLPTLGNCEQFKPMKLVIERKGNYEK